MRRLAVVAAILNVTLGSAAVADTITENLDTGLLVTDLAGVPLGLRLFDSTKGTLTAVTFDAVGRMTAVGNVTNTASQAQSFSVTEDVAFSLTDSGGPLDSVLAGLNLDPDANQKYKRVAPHVPNGFGSYDVSTAPVTLTGPLAAFERPHGGVDPILVSTTTGTTVRGGGGNVSSEIDTRAQALVDVTYTYTPKSTPVTVPEPMSMALLGVGLLGIGAVRRRG